MSLDKCPQKWREVGSGQMSKHVAISKGFWCEGVVNRSLVRLTLVILINPKNGGNMHTLDLHADVHAGVHLWCAFPIGLRRRIRQNGQLAPNSSQQQNGKTPLYVGLS